MSSSFVAKNRWQITQRDAILKPLFYDRHFPGRYHFLDSNDPAQRYADTIVQTKGGQKAIEEKIVHWPSKSGVQRDKAYDAFALETMSCTIPGYESPGWMSTSSADILIYAFSIPKSEVGLDCYVIQMQPLKKWFWEVLETMPWRPTRTDEDNETECRVVPILDVTANVPTKRYQIGHGWPDSHFCEVCCVEAGLGFGVDMRNGKPGKYYCKEHRPK